MKHSITAALFVILGCSVGLAELVGEFPEGGGPITLRTTDGPIQAGGLDLKARAGFLSNGSNPAPWAFYITGNDGVARTQVTLGSLGSAPTIDGTVTLDVSASFDAIIHGTWGKGTTPTRFPINGYVEEPGLTPKLYGSFPYGGGPISLEFENGGLLNSLTLSASRGILRSGGNPSPFSTLSVNTDKLWKADSIADVRLDGRVTLDVAASADAIISPKASSLASPVEFFLFGSAQPSTVVSLTGSYPFGGGPVTVEPTRGAASLLGISLWASPDAIRGGDNSAPFARLEKTASTWFAESDVSVVFEGSVTLDVEATGFGMIGATIHPTGDRRRITIRQEPQGVLSGVYPYGGGPVTIQADDTPVRLDRLSIQAIAGTLDGGNDPSPFDAVDTNTPEAWSVSSLSPVSLDGEVTLDVSASRAAQLVGSSSLNGETSSFGINFDRTLPDSALFEEALAKVTGPTAIFPEDGGPLIFAPGSQPITAGGMDINATGPYLSNGSDPGPWAFYITGNDLTGKTQVTMGSLGGAPTISEPLVLDVIVSAAAGPDDISMTLGNGTTPISFQTLTYREVVPEPSSNFMFTLSTLLILGFRSSRSPLLPPRRTN